MIGRIGLLPSALLTGIFITAFRAAPDHHAKGIRVLESMVDLGFLVTPEWIRTGPTTVVSQKLSLSLLTPKELPIHATAFGSFALEFDVTTGFELGAFPVIYFPGQQLGMNRSAWLGTWILNRLHQLQTVLSKLKSLDEFVNSGGPDDAQLGFELDGPGLTVQQLRSLMNHLFPGDQTVEGLSQALRSTANCWYPTDHLEGQPCESPVLGFFEQREWRILPLVERPGHPVVFSPLDRGSIERLRAAGASFVDGTMPYPTPSAIASHCFLLKTIDGRHVLDFVRRVVVPRSCIPQARAALSRLARVPEVVALEDFFD
jgi:hypothetical protein